MKKNENGQAANDSPVQRDTLPEVTPPPQSVSPNMIRLQGLVVKIDTLRKDDTISFTVQVQEIMDRGSSAPPITKEDTLVIEATSLTDTLRAGSKFVGTISNRQIFGQGSNNTEWQLEQIH